MAAVASEYSSASRHNATSAILCSACRDELGRVGSSFQKSGLVGQEQTCRMAPVSAAQYRRPGRDAPEKSPGHGWRWGSSAQLNSAGGVVAGRGRGSSPAAALGGGRAVCGGGGDGGSQSVKSPAPSARPGMPRSRARASSSFPPGGGHSWAQERARARGRKQRLGGARSGSLGGLGRLPSLARLPGFGLAPSAARAGHCGSTARPTWRLRQNADRLLEGGEGGSA